MTAEHGTNAGYWAHRRHKQAACLACCVAHAQYEDDRRQAPQRRAALAEAISRRKPRTAR